MDRLTAWEKDIEEYEKSTGDNVRDTVKCSVVVDRAPKEVKTHFLLNASEEREYARMRRIIESYYTAALQTDAHDGKVNAIDWKGKRVDWEGKHKGDPKGKAKGDPKGKKGKGKEKGKGKWNQPPPTTNQEKFQGYCGKCGMWGHRQRDCRSGGVSQVEPAAAGAATAGQPAPAPGGTETAMIEDTEWLFMISDEAVIPDEYACNVTDGDDHGRIGTEVEIMIDSGSTATVCGPKHFLDAPVIAGPERRLRTASGTPLKYYGEKHVRLQTRENDKLTVEFAVLNVVRPIISSSASEHKDIETHLGDKFGRKKRSYLKKSSRGGARCLELIAKIGLYFLLVTVIRAASDMDVGALTERFEAMQVATDVSSAHKQSAGSKKVVIDDAGQSRRPAKVGNGAPSSGSQDSWVGTRAAPIHADESITG